jgi:hypothetical protein
MEWLPKKDMRRISSDSLDLHGFPRNHHNGHAARGGDFGERQARASGEDQVDAQRVVTLAFQRVSRRRTVAPVVTSYVCPRK